MFRTKRIAILMAAVIVMSLAACNKRFSREAEALLAEAEAQFDSKQYDKALLTIDSLRRAYPEAIEERKKALTLYQNVALRQAQDDLAHTDSMLLRVNREYADMSVTVDKAKSALRATPEVLQALTLKRMERDSLQVRFDVLCAKIKFIHKKQKEVQ